MQNTIKELASAANKSSYHFNQHNFIKSRVSKIIEFYLTPARIRSIKQSYSALPHKLIRRLGTNLEKSYLGRLSQILVDDFTSVLMAIAKASEAKRQQFIVNSNFAYQFMRSRLKGWYDCCDDCGEMIHLKINLAEDTVTLAAEQPTSPTQKQCAFDNNAAAELVISTPSRTLIVSDSLNDFLLTNSSYLSESYQRFVQDSLCKIDSSSKRGKQMTAEFYASHNLAYLFVGKGLLSVHEHERYVELVRGERNTLMPSPLTLDMKSLYLTMMDYSKFISFCDHIGKRSYHVMKTLNARLVEVHHRKIDILYSMSESASGIIKLEIHPAQSDSSAGSIYSLIA